MRTLLLILGLMLSVPAHALSCGFGPAVLLPGSGSTDMPLNPLFHVRSAGVLGDDQRLVLVRVEDDRRVMVVVEPVLDSDQEIVRVVPIELLDPDTEYTLRVVDATSLSDDSGESDPGESTSAGDLVSFTTGAAEDASPPSTPTLMDAAKRRGTTLFYGSWEDLRLVVDAPSEPVIYRLVIDDGDTVTVLYTDGWEIEEGVHEIRVGQGPCGGDYDVSTRPVEVTVSTIDRAGLSSDGESASRRTGCSTAPGGAVGWLAVVGLLGGRRRGT